MSRHKASKPQQTLRPTTLWKNKPAIAYSSVVFGVAAALGLFCSVMVDGGYGNVRALMCISYGGNVIFILSLITGLLVRLRYRRLSISLIGVVSILAPILAVAIVVIVMSATPVKGFVSPGKTRGNIPLTL